MGTQMGWCWVLQRTTRRTTLRALVWRMQRTRQQRTVSQWGLRWRMRLLQGTERGTPTGRAKWMGMVMVMQRWVPSHSRSGSQSVTQTRPETTTEWEME